VCGGDIGDGTMDISGLRSGRLKRAASDTADAAARQATPCAAGTYPSGCVAVSGTRE
jgi:hypothetical protein